MPRYFFDWHDPTRDRDTSGVDFSDLQAAKDEAARALVEGAMELLPVTDRRELAITVRSEDDMPVFTATLILEVKEATLEPSLDNPRGL